MASDPQVSVKVHADVDDFNSDIKEMANVSAEDIRRGLNDGINDVKTDGLRAKITDAINSIQGAHYETILDMRIQGLDNTRESLAMTLTDIDKMREHAQLMNVDELTNSVEMAKETILLTNDQIKNLSTNMNNLNYSQLASMDATMEQHRQTIATASDQVRIYSQELEKAKTSVDTLADAQGKLGNTVKNTNKQQGELGKTINKSMGKGLVSTKAFMLGMLGVQSAYALLRKSMNQVLQSNPVMKSQVEGITQALGQILTPIMGVVITMFQHLVRWVMIAVAYITTFINVIFGTNIAVVTTVKALDKTSKGMKKTGKSAKKAGKDMKEAFDLAPFDDLNNMLSETDDNMSKMDTGGGVGADMSGIIPPDMSAFDISEYIGPLKEFATWLEKNRTIIELTLVIVGLLFAAFLTYKIVTGIIAGINVVLGIMNDILAINPAVLIIMAIIVVLGLLWIYWDDIVKFIVDVWDVAWGAIKDVASSAWEFIKDGWDLLCAGIMAVVGFVIDAIIGIIDGFIFLVVSLFEGLMGILGLLWDGFVWIVQGVVDIVVGIWNGFIDILKWAIDAYVAYWKFTWNLVWSIIKGVIDIIVGAWNFLWDGVKSVARGAFDFLKTSVDNIGKTFKNVFDKIGDTIKGVFEGIKKVFKNVWDWILNQMGKGGSIFKGVVDSVSNVFKKIVNSMINGINTVISIPFKAINGALGKMKGISLLGMKPFGWLPTISVPKIPQLWQGGDIGSSRGGTLVNVAERGKSEMVVPLGTSPDGQAFIQKIANQTSEQVGNNGGDTNVDFVIKIGEETLGRTTIRAINKVQRNAGKVLVKI